MKTHTPADGRTAHLTFALPATVIDEIADAVAERLRDGDLSRTPRLADRRPDEPPVATLVEIANARRLKFISRTIWTILSERLPPRADRDPASPLFGDATADRLRTAIGRGCKAAGVPHFSPHALRHRRISLLTSRA